MAKTIEFKPKGRATGVIGLQKPNTIATDLTYARTGLATERKKDGTLDTAVSANKPLYSFDLGDNCPHYLQEPSGENLYTYSEEFEDASWTKIALTANDAVAVSVRGDVTASEIVPTTANTQHYLDETVSASASTKYAVSIWAKRKTGGGRYLQIATSTGFISNRYQNYDLETGELASGDLEAGSVVDIENWGNGWYRCIHIAETGGAATNARALFLSLDFDEIRNPVYEGDGVGCYIWGAQIEDNDFATGYMATSGATASRGQATAIGGGDTASINSQAGAFTLNLKGLFNTGAFRSISLSDGSAANSVEIYLSSTDNRIGAKYVVGSVTQAEMQFDVSDIKQFNKITFVYEENNFFVCGNGIKIDEDTIGSVQSAGTMNELRLDNGAGASDFEGGIKYLAVDDTALTQLQAEAESGFGAWSEMANQLKYTVE